MMKKTLLAALLAAMLPWGAAAQVEKQVEVTKAYVPSVESAQKLPITPDRTDTVKLRPEIDYTITPLSLRTALATRPIRPATVTYWEFNRPLPFYLKAGAGYPLNSVLDFYASSQNPATGYVVGYVNHEGRYADIRNDFGAKNNSLTMANRIGAAAGKYLGKHVLEGEVFYDHRIFHRYGLYNPPGSISFPEPGSRVMYGDAGVDLRFGDDFQDLSRFNFEVALHGGLFSGTPEAFDSPAGEGMEALRTEPRMRQTSWGASARIARAWGRSRFSVDVGFTRMDGRKVLDGVWQQTIRAGLRYGFDGGVVRFEAGADFYHDRTEQRAVPEPFTGHGNYLVPALRMDFNLGTVGLKPFVEIDGSVRPNDYRTLAQWNPYLADNLWMDKSSVDYNGRFGIGGSLWRDRFTYRVYAGYSIRDNRPYWFSWNHFEGDMESESRLSGPFQAQTGRQTAASISAGAEYRPLSELHITLNLHGYVYHDDACLSDALMTDRKIRLENGAPAFEGDVGIRYAGRKVAFGVQVLLQSERTWTAGAAWTAPSQAGEAGSGTLVRDFTAPFAVDLRLTFDWKVSSRVSLFAEGRNLADRRLYRFPWYPEYGANFTLGVKANF